jgi:AcrR family transcriptional regulator
MLSTQPPEKSKPLTRREQHKENLRGQILQAAWQIGKEEGWKALTIRRIATAINYQPPVVYQFFASKEELLVDLLSEAIREFQTSIHSLIAEPNQTPTDILISFALGRFDHAILHPEIFDLLFSTEVMQLIHDQHPDQIGNIRSVLDRLLGQITPPGHDPLMTFTNLWVLINGYILLTKTNHLMSKLELENQQVRIHLKAALERFCQSFMSGQR